MKKFLAFFVLLLSFSGALCALTSEERFLAVKEKYPSAEKFMSDVQSVFIYIEGAELRIQKQALENFLKEKPDATLIVDFKCGDGFVNTIREITLKAENFPIGLQKLVITNTEHDVTKARGYFLSGCTEFTHLNLDLPALKKVEKYFLSGCVRLSTLNFSFPALKKVGDNFLSSCKELSTLNLDFSALKKVGDNFLWGCEKLVILNLILPKIVSVGESFLAWCNALTQMNGLNDDMMRRLDKNSCKNVIRRLRESNDSQQQALGAKFYTQYIYKPAPALESVLKPWNFDTLQAITPKRLDDIQDLTGKDVLAIFDAVIAVLRKVFDGEVKNGFYDKFKDKKGRSLKEKMIEEKEALFKSYFPHFRPIVEFLYGADVRIAWPMYEEEKPHMATTFKHIAKKLQSLKIEEQATYMFEFLEALENCQSRQSAIVNSVAAKMGLLPFVTDRGRLNDFYNLINTFKLEQFNQAVAPIQAAGETHAYGRYFTALDCKIGVPAALHMKEKISRLTDEDISAIWSEFFNVFFTPDILVDYVVKTIDEANTTEEKQLDPDNKRSYMNVRFELWEAEGQSIKDRYLKNGEHDISAYFKVLNKNENFDHHEAPITQAEAKRLLVLMQILKPIEEETLMEG